MNKELSIYCADNSNIIKQPLAELSSHLIQLSPVNEVVSPVWVLVFLMTEDLPGWLNGQEYL